VSLLAKGLVGVVIPIGVVGLYYLFQRKLPGRNTLISVVWGVPLALIVAATWYLPVIMRHGWPFIEQFIVQHHFARYISDKYHHWRPVYYYLLVVPLLALPWTAFLIDSLVQFKSWFQRAGVPPGDHTEERLNRLMIFALAWFLFPLVFFSFSNSKLPGYILPILPAAALIIGERLWRLGSNADDRRWPIATTAAIGLLFALGVLAYSWRTTTLQHGPAILIATPLFVAGGFILFAPQKRKAAIVLLAGATGVVLMVALLCVAPAFAELESSKRLLQLADARGYSQTAIYGLQRSDRTPEFYAAGRVVYGADGEPIMYEGPEQVIYESRQRKDAVLVFVPVEEVGKLTAVPSVQTDVLGNNIRYAIVAVRAR
jgi:4-amino-4-deoxy-L-arabinose transferase-like glycosyltransferase